MRCVLLMEMCQYPSRFCVYWWTFLFCVGASLRKCVCLKTKPKPEEKAARKTSARSIDEEDSMNLRNSVMLDPTSVRAF